jgi:hypothetical protein
VDARIAADDDRLALDARTEGHADRAHGRILEIALGNTADVVFAKAARVHRSEIPREPACGKGVGDLAYVLCGILPDDEDRIAALDDDEI